MKHILTCLCLFLALCTFAQPAQPDINLLDKDPVFRKTLSRRLKYPSYNAQGGYTKLVYVQFVINEKGHLQNTRVFNPAVGKYYFIDFDRAVESALNRLPPLNPRHAGKYILPVSFVLNDFHTGRKTIPTNTNFDGILPEHTLLKTVTVTGYKYTRPTQEPGRENYNSVLIL